MRGVPLQNSPQLTGNRTPLYDLDFTFILTCQGRTNSRQSKKLINNYAYGREFVATTSLDNE